MQVSKIPSPPFLAYEAAGVVERMCLYYVVAKAAESAQERQKAEKSGAVD